MPNRPGPAHLPQDVRALLDESGLEWEVVVGRKHAKLFVRGAFVQRFPRTYREGYEGRQAANARAAVRRVLREAKAP